MSRFFVKVRLKNVSLLATICIAVFTVFLYHSIVKLGGTTVTIQNVTESSEASVSLRGGMNDDTWYNASDIVKKGNWTYDAEQRIYTSTDDEALVLRIPPVKHFNIIFNAGPNEGKVQIKMGDDTYLCDLYQENENEYGYAFSLQGLKKNFIITNTVSALLCLIIFILCMYLVAFYEEKKSLINWNIVEKAFVILMLPIVIFILYFLSLSSTPRIPESACFWGYDAAVFNLVGKAWGAGMTPYSACFENKGPLIFFVYMVGNKIDATWGVFAIQAIAVYASLIFSYKIGKLLTNIPKGILASLATLIYYAGVMDEGALTEDFNLPFLMISTYLIIKYLNSVEEKSEHPYKVAIVHGITIGASLLLRVTNCIAICGFLACVGVYLAVNKKYINLFKNIVAGLVGFGLIVTPFVIYFYAKGALADLAYGTILFNMEYAAEAVSHTLNEWKTIGVYLVPVLICILLAFEQKMMTRVTILVGAIAATVLMMRSYLYPHYYIILLPFVPIGIGWMLQGKKLRLDHLNRYVLSYSIVMTSICTMLFYQCATNAMDKYSWISRLNESNAPSQYVAAIKAQSDLIPEEERDMVIGYNVRSDWYLISGIYPCFKHGFDQDYRNGISERTQEETVNFFESLTAEWIVVQRDIGIPEIKNVIDQHYTQIDSTHIEEGDYWLTLYKKNK